MDGPLLLEGVQRREQAIVVASHLLPSHVGQLEPLVGLERVFLLGHGDGLSSEGDVKGGVRGDAGKDGRLPDKARHGEHVRGGRERGRVVGIVNKEEEKLLLATDSFPFPLLGVARVAADVVAGEVVQVKGRELLEVLVVEVGTWDEIVHFGQR